MSQWFSGQTGSRAIAGGRPAADHFLLSRQEKVIKEKAALVIRTCVSPVLLTELGVCDNSRAK